MNYFSHSNSDEALIVVSIIIFLLGSKINLGIIISAIIFIGGVYLTVEKKPYNLLVFSLGLIGLTACGYRQFIHKKKNLDVKIIFISILLALSGISLIHYKHFVSLVLLFIGASGVVLGYTHRFFSKSGKNFEDILKLFIIYNTAGFIYSIILHLGYNLYLVISFYILFFIWTLYSIIKILLEI